MGRLKQYLEKVKNFKKDQWLIIVLAGILLFIIALPTEKKKEKAKEEGGSETAAMEEAGEGAGELGEDYGSYLEEKLEEILSQMKGVGKVKVMITLADAGEEVLEKDTKESRTETNEGSGETGRKATETDLEYTTIFVEESGVRRPYIIRKKNPKVEGVVVIAEGGGNSVVAQNISKAVGALFSIESHKIMVMKME